MEDKKVSRGHIQIDIEAMKVLSDLLSNTEISTFFNLLKLCGNNNRLRDFNDKTSYKTLSTELKTGKNLISGIIRKFKSLGIIKNFLNPNEYSEEWILNPFIAVGSRNNSISPVGFITPQQMEEFKNTEIYCHLPKEVSCGNECMEYKNITLSSLDITHNLYILRQKFSESYLYKLGYSSNIKKRMYSYFYHNPGIEIIKTFYKEDAKEFEKTFHKDHRAIYLNEWYDEITIKNYL